MDLQDLEQKYKEMGAEIERLKQQPEGVWGPELGEAYYRVGVAGAVDCFSLKVYSGSGLLAHHNVYKTKALAEKASVLQRRSNLVIQACLNFDPDFVPNWSDNYQRKFGFYYSYDRGAWGRGYACMHGAVVVCVSTPELADKVVAYLNSQEIK